MDQRFWLVLSIFLSVFVTGYSQDVTDYLDKGDRFLSKKDYTQALDLFLKAYQTSPDDAGVNYRIGLTYLYLPKKSKALPFLQKAYDRKPEVDEDIEYHLGMAYQFNYQFQPAMEHYKRFQIQNKKLAAIADQKIHECFISDSLTRRPLQVEIENIGTIVNNDTHEYAPIISADGNTLIFTSNRPTDGNDKRGPKESFEDVYMCKRVNGTWGMPQLISPKINIKFNDAAASLSPDGNTLFLYYEQGSGDIYTSTLKDGKWSDPVALNKHINTPFWETSACLSPDGQQLYFTSARPGGYGDLDIYVSEKDRNGEWGKATNLGKTINSAGNEDAPFIHADGTLYFSSDGHPTMGSNDIFMCRWEDGAWAPPVNLGYPINSIEYDGFFSLSDDKQSGYFSTIREDGYGNTDIYHITFLEDPEILREEIIAKEKAPEPITPVAPTPPPTEGAEAPAEDDSYVDPIVQWHRENKVATVLKGKVIDAATAAPLGAVITLTDNETNKVLARVRSDKETGDFELIIPNGGNYGVATERFGYLFNSINFNMPEFTEYQELDTHIILEKAEVGSKTVLKNVFFDTGDATLKPQSISELQHVYELLYKNPSLKVQINGHTDNTGDAAANKVLSLQRAESVVHYLIEKGIHKARLTAVGYGEERPLVSNDDEADGREINRRTEIEVVGG